MIRTLDEVPGARERPGNCPIQITHRDDESFLLSLPTRGVSPIIWFFSAVLLSNIAVTLYTGAYLLLGHRSVLFMAQISPGGLPRSLNHYDLWLWLLLMLAAGLGLWTLAAILKPVAAREEIEISREWLTVRHWAWGRLAERRMVRGDVRGFLLRRVPPGLDAGIVTVQGRGEEIVVGEYLRETDREWLVSAGNALVRE